MFVPGSHVELKDAAAREEQLRQGRIVVGGREEDVRIDDDKLEAAAEQLAKDRFNEYFVGQLKDLPCPPKSVVALSRSKLRTLG